MGLPSGLPRVLQAESRPGLALGLPLGLLSGLLPGSNHDCRQDFFQDCLQDCLQCLFFRIIILTLIEISDTVADKWPARSILTMVSPHLSSTIMILLHSKTISLFLVIHSMDMTL